MGTRIIKVPDVGEGIAEVELVAWAVEVGQPVRRNEVVAEVMTDKATVEVPAPSDGVVESLDGNVGDVLLVGSELFHLSIEGESPDSETDTGSAPASPPPPAHRDSSPTEPQQPAAPSQNQPATPPPEFQQATPPVTAAAPIANNNDLARPKASPALRRRAREAGIELKRVPGTGPAGRVTHEDLDLFIGSGGQHAQPSTGQHSQIRRSAAPVDKPLVGIRRKIAQRMVEAVTTIPHITYVEEVDVTALEDLRATLNERRSEEQPRLTLLPFLIRAITNEVVNHPKMNAHVDDDAGVIRTFHGVHVGVATQTDNGLVVPVLHHAEAETLWSSADRLRALADLTRSGKASSADLSGSTITISSLGAIGGIVTTPVINKPEVAIVGVNKIVVKPVFIDGEFVPRKIMNLSSSFDHRVIDGWDAAQFIQALRVQLEQPALLFVDQA